MPTEPKARPADASEATSTTMAAMPIPTEWQRQNEASAVARRTAGVLERVKAVADARQAQLSDQWQQAVKAVAAGDAVDAKKLADAIASLGRTAADFEAAVGIYVSRLVLVQQMTDAAAAEPLMHEARGQLLDLDNEFAKAKSAHAAARRPFVDRIDFLRDRLNNAVHARERLFNSAPAHLKAKLKTLDADTRAATTQVRGLREKLDGAKAQSRIEEHYRGVDYRETVEAAKARVPVLEADLAAAEQRVAELLAEQERTVAACYLP